MVPMLKETEGANLSLRCRARRFWIEEKWLAQIGRSVLFHAVIALPLEALLLGWAVRAARDPRGGDGCVHGRSRLLQF